MQNSKTLLLWTGNRHIHPLYLTSIVYKVGWINQYICNGWPSLPCLCFSDTVVIVALKLYSQYQYTIRDWEYLQSSFIDRHTDYISRPLPTHTLAVFAQGRILLVTWKTHHTKDDAIGQGISKLVVPVPLATNINWCRQWPLHRETSGKWLHIQRDCITKCDAGHSHDETTGEIAILVT